MNTNHKDLLRNRLHKLGYRFEELEDFVFLVYDVFSDEDLAPVLDIINNASQADWEHDYLQSQIDLAGKKYGRDDLDNLIKEGLMEFTDDWYDKAISIPEDITARLSMKIEIIFENWLKKNTHINHLTQTSIENLYHLINAELTSILTKNLIKL